MSREIICKINNITKRFAGVVALHNVSFDIGKGEVHAIVGENGAGKSTLMNILSGVYKPDEGEVIFEGKAVHFEGPGDSQDTGIAMIHQELSLSPHMSAAENVFINRMPRKKTGLIDKGKMCSECKRYLEILGVHHINPAAMVHTLSVSEQQMLEIVKAISLNARMLIMDEPTSSLTSTEVEFLLSIIDKLRKQGVAILYISHKLEEIMRIADMITVLRDGEHVATERKADLNERAMVNLMVGREFEQAMVRDYMRDYDNKKPVLSVKNLCDYAGRVKDVSFDLYPGEVLGLTGLVGAGRTELLQCIFGANKIKSGEIYVEGKKVNIRECGDAINHGLGLIPEGRKIQGLFLKMTVEDNMLSVYQKKCTYPLGLLKKAELKGIAQHYREQLNIKTPSLYQQVVNLSGGNQQKTIVARWLMNSPKILFMDEPTHGIDIGAKMEIYKIIDRLSKDGVSVILLSSEMPEVLSLCDRIMVMYNGQLRGTVRHDEANQVKLMSFTLEENQKEAANS